MLLWKIWGLLPRSKSRGTFEISGEERSFICFGNEGSKVCNFNFFSFASQCSINTYSNGQYRYPFIFGKNGRYSKQISDCFEQGNMGLSVEKEITITVEYLLGLLSVGSETQSRKVSDASK